ncbi:MAG: hypothetical protein AB1505_13890 [Candidatus Latescibacterota bacterium]
MAFVLRFVQRYRPADRQTFLELEARSAALEARRSDFPHGRRLQPYAGREPTNTLIWEAAFPALEAVRPALALIESDPEHAELFRQQVPCFLDGYTEIHEAISGGQRPAAASPVAPAPGATHEVLDFEEKP